MDCISLLSIDLSHFNINNLNDMIGIFSYLQKDCKIVCNDKNIKK